MRAVAYRLRRLIRARVGATVGLTFIVAVLVGVAISCAAGARRTTSAPDRYTAVAAHGFDAQIMQDSGLPRTAEIAQLPGVAAAEAMTFLFAGVAPHGTTDFLDAIAFAGLPAPSGAQLASGHLPNPTNHDEFIATRDFIGANGLSIGDSLDVITLTPDQVQTSGFDVNTPEGPTWTAELVGVLDGSAGLDDAASIVVFSAALLDDPRIAFASSVMWIDEQPGTDLAGIRSQLDAMPDSEQFTLQDVLVGTEIRTAVQAQGRGLWLLALVSAVAAIAVLGQLITRHVRLSADDRERLSAVGFTDSQILAESVGRAALPIAAGCIVGAALAIAPSSLFPTGFVKAIEPTPGIRVDLVVLLLGAVVFLVALTSWTVIALLLTTRKARAVRPSPMIEALAARAPSATAATGLRFAFTRRGKDRGSVKGAMAGLILTVGALVGALTFGVSLNRLVDEPARFGVNYDISTDDGADVVPPEVLDVIENDPGIAGALLYSNEQARSDEQTVDLLGMEPVSGDLRPRVLSGRLPDAQDEVALGRLTSNDLSAPIGADITLVLGGTTQVFHVTGIAVLPGIAGDEGIGHGAVLTMVGLQRLAPDAVANVALVDVRDDAPPGTLERLATAIGVQGGFDEPSAIVNLRRIRAIPFVLMGVLAVLLVLTVAHVMLTSLRNGRRDLAILRSLGADPGWIGRAMHWQVTAFALVPMVCGAALGIVAGRLVFQALADSIGAVNDAKIPLAFVGLVAAAGLVLSNGTASIPARRARRIATATVLQTE